MSVSVWKEGSRYLGSYKNEHARKGMPVHIKRRIWLQKGHGKGTGKKSRDLLLGFQPTLSKIPLQKVLETVSQSFQTTVSWSGIFINLGFIRETALQYLNCQSVLNLNVSLCTLAGLCRMAKSRIGLELSPAGQGLSSLPGLYKPVLTLLCVCLFAA